MSYILDALRRANSERERGSVPTLNADPGPADRAVDEDTDRAAPRSQRLSWLILGAMAALVLAVGAIWLWPAREQQVPPIGELPRAQQALPLPDRVTASRAPAPAAPPPTIPLSVPPAEEILPRAPAPVVQATGPQAAASSAERPVPPKAELPEELRRQLPPLVTSGAMYSDTPANRMVIINGQVLHEGDKLTPDLALEQIMLKGAVLSFKGQRFSISY